MLILLPGFGEIKKIYSQDWFCVEGVIHDLGPVWTLLLSYSSNQRSTFGFWHSDDNGMTSLDS